MAIYYNEPSRTFSEYLLIPNLTTKQCIPDNVSLRTPISRYKKGESKPLMINLPFASAIMQAVSDHNMAIALARCGGISFIYASQPIEAQADMVRRVKNHKAGFVPSDSNLKPDDTLADAMALTARTGHSTIAVTADGTAGGKLMGIITSRDYRVGKCSPEAKICEYMTPLSHLIFGKEGITLSEANDLIWKHKLNCLPIVDEQGNLRYLVFRKDYTSHKENPDELLDASKRLMVGAGINTRDYRERVPALLEAGADVLCVDSSDGFTEWQGETIKYLKSTYGERLKIGGGNVVDAEGFLYLAECGADFVKIGIGGGSICITREQKGIGRGQATAVIEVAKARNEYFEKTGIYVPLCSDGGIVHDYHITLALAMGADFVMLGRYFARFDESPGRKLRKGMSYVKEYWGEGSNRARNWHRYDLGSEGKLAFEEGVDSYVPYAGSLKDNLDLTVSKIKSTMCNCGALTIAELQQKARITLVSAIGIREGGAHDVMLKNEDEFGS
ncbi:MAG TPA: IMP dehydrogenase [Bacillota bacterium]